MKSYLLALLLAPILCFAQNSMIDNNFPTKDGKIVYTDVVKMVDSLSADDLYFNAKKWITTSFNSGKAVTQTDDKNSHLIIIKSYFEKGHNAMVKNPKNWFVLKIETKDNRYKYNIDNVEYEFDVVVMGSNQHYDPVPFENWMKPSSHKNEKKRAAIDIALNKYCQELNNKFEGIIESLKIAMIESSEDDW